MDRIKDNIVSHFLNKQRKFYIRIIVMIIGKAFVYQTKFWYNQIFIKIEIVISKFL